MNVSVYIRACTACPTGTRAKYIIDDSNIIAVCSKCGARLLLTPATPGPPPAARVPPTDPVPPTTPQGQQVVDGLRVLWLLRAVMNTGLVLHPKAMTSLGRIVGIQKRVITWLARS